MIHTQILYTLFLALASIGMLKSNTFALLQNNKEGVIEYLPSGKLQGKKVPIHFYIPSGDLSTMTCQIILHGASRNANEYIAVWRKYADEFNLILIAPEFAEEQFKISEYTQGMMVSNNTIDTNEHLFKLIDEIFVWFVELNQLPQRKFNIFGHSAGGQFVHRSLLFHDSPYVDRAVAANPGWYTYPFPKSQYPYGTGGLENHKSEEAIQNYYQKNLILALGTADTLRTGKVRVTKEADEQGLHRYERGLNYFESNKANALSRNYAFNWRVHEVTDSGHDHTLMSPSVLLLLYQTDKK